MLTFALSALAEEGDLLWNQYYGNSNTEAAYSVLETDDSGLITAGVSFQGSDGDIWVIKTDALGDSVWSRYYDFSPRDIAVAIAPTSDGGFVLAGLTNYYIYFRSDILLMKITSHGDLVWRKAYGGILDDYAFDVIETDDGGFILAGATNSQQYGTYFGQLCILKTNAQGDSLWSKRYEGNPFSEATQIMQMPDNGYMVAGYVSTTPSNMDIWLLRTDQNGDTLWTETYGSPNGDYAWSMITTRDDNLVLSGMFNYVLDTDISSAALIMKTTIEGDSIWAQLYGGTGINEAYDVIELSSGGYLLAVHGIRDLIRTDDLGALMWQKSFDIDNQYVPYSVLENSQFDYIIAGQSIITADFNTDVWLAALEGVHTSVNPETVPVPDQFRITGVYPNPFNPTTTITFDLPVASEVRLDVFNVNGSQVGTGLAPTRYNAGTHSITFDGSHFSSGIYFYQLAAGEYSAIGKMVLLK